jgi:hypothetical protein
VSLDKPFWDECDLNVLYPQPGRPIYHLLLSDRDLAWRMGRKTEWRITGHFNFWNTREQVPNFPDNLRSLIIDLNYISEVMDFLKYYDAPLTKLFIHLNEYIAARDVNLDLIALSCPHLTELGLFRITKYIGTLSENTNIESLTLDFWVPVPDPHLDTLLPLRSSSRLRSLTLHRWCEEFEVSENALEQFPHLSALSITRPSLHWIYEDFAPVTNQLSQLHMDLPKHGDWHDPVVQFFYSSAFANLEVLSIGHGRKSQPSNLNAYSGLEELLDLVTGKIWTLKEFEWNLLMELSWIDYFSRLTNLEVLGLKIRTVTERGEISR